jgi:hypothetical protein
MLRLIVTCAVLTPQLYSLYLDNFVSKHVGQDAFALIGPMFLVGTVCLLLFFYESVQLYKGIRDKSYSGTDIFEMTLLLFIAGIYGAVPLGIIFAIAHEGLKIPLIRRFGDFLGQIAQFSMYANSLLIKILIVSYALWFYRIFIAKRTRSIQ